MKPALSLNGADARRILEFVHDLANLRISACTTTEYLLTLDALRDRARYVLVHYQALGSDMPTEPRP